MKKKRRKNKNKLKIANILFLLSLLASLYLIYNILLLKNIENIIRIVLIVLIIGINFYFYRRNLIKRKNKGLLITIMTLFIICNLLIGGVINKIYSSIDNINKDKITYSSYLIAMNDSDISEIDDCFKKKIGILNNEANVDNYIIPMEIIKDNELDSDNEIVKYDDLFDMLDDLYKGKIDMMFVSSNYNSMFSTTTGYENINSEVKVITSSKKTIDKEKTEEEQSTGKKVTEPFTVLLMGVDSEKDGLDSSSSNGDSLILITFNPSTLNATMLSIPRDSYVPIMCFKNHKENKLTHAAWYGSSCMIKTIENFLDIDIDYYVKINFKGVVSLVNALEGVQADVPRDLCTDSSDRTGKICIKKGTQNLDGESALVLARNRYDLPNGDFDRAKNQQVLLKSILNKMKTVRSISKFNEILDSVSRNMDTNLKTEQILSFYNIFKDIVKVNRINKDVVNIERLSLTGTGQNIYEESSKLTLWNYVLNENSIKEVNKAMNDNLNSDVELIKNFNYLVSNGYKETVPGANVKPTTLYTLLPSFIGKTKEDVEEFVKKNKIKVKYLYKEDDNSKYDNGSIIKQNYMANTRIDKINTLEITILKNKKSEKIDCTDNFKDICLLPSLIGKTKDEVNSYFNKYKDLDKITFNEVSQALYPNAKVGTVVSQNYKVNTHLLKVKNLELTIVTK